MEAPRSLAERDFRYAPTPMNRDLHFVTTSWMQGMFRRAAVLRALDRIPNCKKMIDLVQ